MIELPPLRQRDEDVEVLEIRFLRGLVPEGQLGQDALAAIRAYARPGNVRELRNAIAWAAGMATGPFVTAKDVPRRGRVLRIEEALRAGTYNAWNNSGESSTLRSWQSQPPLRERTSTLLGPQGG